MDMTIPSSPVRRGGTPPTSATSQTSHSFRGADAGIGARLIQLAHLAAAVHMAQAARPGSSNRIAAAADRPARPPGARIAFAEGAD